MDLEKLLWENKIDTQKWSYSYGTKEIKDLKREIIAGETNLEIINNHLTRVVTIVTIIVNVQLGDQQFTLVEDKQICFNGVVRNRISRNISEKVKSNETPYSAAKRALQEEIGLDFQGNLLFEGEETEEKKSPSYPGLNSLYKMFKYRIMISANDLIHLRFSEVQPEKISLFTLKSEDEL